MRSGESVLRKWEAPRASELGETVEAFLDKLGGPAWIHVPGSDRSRSRVVTTLLHGNEPSGVRALYRWLHAERTPIVDMVFFVGSVEAAIRPPGFHFRFLPDAKDLNRCFREPFEGKEGRLAFTLLQELRTLRPEALIDLHNTSGRSPAYGVTTRVGPSQMALTSLFSNQLILTDLRLGTLMEVVEEEWPTIVIECGGASSSESDQVALEGLQRFVSESDILQADWKNKGVQVYRNPIRVELCEGRTVAYQSSPAANADLTLLPDVDKFNFDCVPSGEMLGWVGKSQGRVIVARGADGQDHTQDLFVEKDGCLVMAVPARILMMTTNPTMVTNDCLFYVLPVENPDHVI